MNHEFDGLVSALDETERLEQLLEIWRFALQYIANGDSGRWGRIALEALDKEKRP